MMYFFDLFSSLISIIVGLIGSFLGKVAIYIAIIIIIIVFAILFLYMRMEKRKKEIASNKFQALKILADSNKLHTIKLIIQELDENLFKPMKDSGTNKVEILNATFTYDLKKGNQPNMYDVKYSVDLLLKNTNKKISGDIPYQVYFINETSSDTVKDFVVKEDNKVVNGFKYVNCKYKPSWEKYNQEFTKNSKYTSIYEFKIDISFPENKIKELKYEYTIDNEFNCLKGDDFQITPLIFGNKLNKCIVIVNLPDNIKYSISYYEIDFNSSNCSYEKRKEAEQLEEKKYQLIIDKPSVEKVYFIELFPIKKGDVCNDNSN